MSDGVKQIGPIIAHIPAPVTREYILAHWIKREWVGLIEGLLEATIAWSSATSQPIAGGEELPSGGQGGLG